MLTPTETPPTVTGGVLTGSGTAGSGTVTVVVVVVLVVLVVDVVLPVVAPPEPLAAGVVALPPAEAVTGRLDRPGTVLPLPPRGSDGSVGEVEPVPPVAPEAAAVTPSRRAAMPPVPDSRELGVPAEAGRTLSSALEPREAEARDTAGGQR